MSNDITAAGSLIQIISQSRQSALKKVNEELINVYWRVPEYYRAVAEKYGCIFFNAAEYIYPSEVDSLHLTPEGHSILAEKLYEVVKNV